MKFVKKRRVWPADIVRTLIEKGEGDFYQYNANRAAEILLRYYNIDEYERNQDTPLKFYWRLTWLLYAGFWLTLFLSSPIKWFLTGTRYYQHDGIIMTIFYTWQKKLGI